ncbi:NYN domain-containing protein [Candidatus Uhrbacteria bacterium]|jgi:uncharacterized LabA/DUF88 family protein|nr:NYN domain-containing protein [Candidatus Uhrbacteria bacterium]
MFKHKDQRVGVFIDTQNMYYSARNLFKRKVNFKNIVEDAVAGRRLIRANAYVVRTKGEEERPFFEALQKSGIETREKELQEYQNGNKKADWDVGLAIDVVQMLDMLDVVVIASGDGDYIPLVEYCQGRGRMVEIMAFGETTSSNLLDYVHDYTNLSENRRRYLIGPILKGGTKKVTKGKTKESAPEPEEEKQGFFMATDNDDQEENRGRRLEF